MPWMSIIMAIISYLMSMKQNPEKKGRAVAAAALAGLGTYYVTHETEWGRENLGALDGVPTVTTDGTTVEGAGGTVKVPSVTTGSPTSTTGAWDVLKDWGPGGTAAVIGTGAVAASGGLSKYFPWLIGFGAIWLLSR